MTDWYESYKRERKTVEDTWEAAGYLVTKWNDSQMFVPLVGELTCKVCWCSVDPEYADRHNKYHIYRR